MISKINRLARCKEGHKFAEFMLRILVDEFAAGPVWADVWQAYTKNAKGEAHAKSFIRSFVTLAMKYNPSAIVTFQLEFQGASDAISGNGSVNVDVLADAIYRGMVEREARKEMKLAASIQLGGKHGEC